MRGWSQWQRFFPGSKWSKLHLRLPSLGIQYWEETPRASGFKGQQSLWKEELEDTESPYLKGAHKISDISSPSERTLVHMSVTLHPLLQAISNRGLPVHWWVSTDSRSPGLTANCTRTWLCPPASWQPNRPGAALSPENPRERPHCNPGTASTTGRTPLKHLTGDQRTACR